MRAADNTERWLGTIDPANGKTKVLDRIKDDAWVRDGGQGWLPDNRRVWFLAEHDGWMHLYTVDATHRPTRKQLTTGKFEIDSVELSPDGRTFYIQSTEPHPGEHHLYAMSVDGGPRTKLTAEVGGASRHPFARQLDVRPGVVVDEPSAGSVREGEPRRRQAGRVTTSPSKEWMAQSGSSRSWSPTKRATAPRCMRACLRRRWSARSAIRRRRR